MFDGGLVLSIACVWPRCLYDSCEQSRKCERKEKRAKESKRESERWESARRKGKRKELA